jgi:DNA polymerase-1
VKRTLLVDADIIAYQVSASTEDVFYFDGKDAPPVVDADLSSALRKADQRIEELRDTLRADDIVICLTDRGKEFRRDFWPDYLGNRKGRKPENLFKVLDHFAGKYKTYQRPRLEADDCLGILSTHPTLVPGEKIIVSEDKDLKTIPGMLFNPAKHDEPVKIGKLQADRQHLAQTITGDQCDNYPGARGIGPKSPEVAGVLASKTVAEAWSHVMAAFTRAAIKTAQKTGKEPTDINMTAVATQATVQARCARILRASDWDFRTKRPILWTPPRLPN